MTISPRATATEVIRLVNKTTTLKINALPAMREEVSDVVLYLSFLIFAFMLPLPPVLDNRTTRL